MEFHETTAPLPGAALTFEQVWASLMELKEFQRETARQMKETDKRMGDLTKRFGETVEYMVVPNLVAKFQELGFTFSRVARDVKIVDREHDIITEIDAFLENGDKVMVVETKVKPNTKDIDDHIERMGKLRAYADIRQDRRVYLGALVGAVFDEGVKTYALKNGFYVLEPSGETFTITQPRDRGYSPREW